MWFCRKASSRSWSCRQARRESQRSWAETCRRRTWKAATGRNRVQKTNNWWTRSKGKWSTFPSMSNQQGAPSSATQALFCICWGQTFHFHLRRRWHLRFLNATSREDFRVLRNLKSLIDILYRFIKVSLHFLSGFKANIADTRVFHLVCGTGKNQRALKLRTGKLSIDLCPGLKVK